MSDIHHRALTGTFWAYMQNWVAKGLTLVVFFVLARLLSPADFGVFAIATVMLTLGEVFVEQGLSYAIVQRSELDDEHISTAFWATLLLGILLALTALIISHPLGVHFGHPQIAAITSTLAPVFVLMALASVPAALLRRELHYKILAQRAMLANTLSGITAIAMALSGAGVWTFVGQQLVYQTVGLIVLWKNETWRPRFIFSWQHFIELLGFSSKVISVKLLDFAETRGFDLIVGHFLGIRSLGQYSLATRAQQSLTQLIVAPLWDANLSILARMSTQPDQRKKAYLGAMTFASLIPLPIFLIIAATAPVLVPTVFGQQWTASAEALQILALLGAIRSLVFLNGVFLQAAGLAGITITISVIRVVVALMSLFVLLPYGITGVATALLVGQLASTPLSFSVTKRYLGISFRDTLASILKPLFAALFATACVMAIVTKLQDAMPAWGVLLCGLLAGGVIYTGLIVCLMPRTLLPIANRLPKAIRGYVTIPIAKLLALREQSWLWSYECVFRIMSKWVPQPRSGGILIIPGDTAAIGGSLGDQALLGGIVAVLTQKGYKEIMVLCKRGAEPPPPLGIAINLIPAWNDLRSIPLLIKTIKSVDTVIVIGADTLDGFYSPFESGMRILLADLSNSLGCHTRMISFSFNAQPHPSTITALRNLPDAVQLFVRDNVSADRVAGFTGHTPHLVADIGFLIQPALSCALDKSVGDWAQDQKQQKRAVVAWNISPHSLHNLGADAVSKVITASAQVIRCLISEHNAAVILVPHDSRSHASDLQLLIRLKEALVDISDNRVLLLSDAYNAMEIKAACRHCDFLFTGRMHLMVAALCSGVPAVAIEYQGKFTGLFNLFQFDTSYTITAELACNKVELEHFVISKFIERNKIKKSLLERLPGVLKLSEKNLACLAKARS